MVTSSVFVRRNSIIEFSRFLAAFGILCFHGFGPMYLPRGYLLVSFFFILSGSFFINQFKKSKSFFQFTCKRLLGLGFIFLISFAFNIWWYYYRVLYGLDVIFTLNFDGFWGVLWYIPNMLIALCTMYLLFLLVKKNLIRILILSFIVVFYALTVYLNLMPLTSYLGIFNEPVKAIVDVSFGVLIFMLPKIKIKVVNILCFIIIAALLLVQVFLPNLGILYTLLLTLTFGLYIYFAFQLEIKWRWLNNLFCYLGSLSFGLYCFQNVACVLSANGVKDSIVLFSVVLLLTILANQKSFKKIFINDNKRNSLQN